VPVAARNRRATRGGSRGAGGFFTSFSACWGSRLTAPKPIDMADKMSAAYCQPERLDSACGNRIASRGLPEASLAKGFPAPHADEENSPCG